MKHKKQADPGESFRDYDVYIMSREMVARSKAERGKRERALGIVPDSNLRYKDQLTQLRTQGSARSLALGKASAALQQLQAIEKIDERLGQVDNVHGDLATRAPAATATAKW